MNQISYEEIMNMAVDFMNAKHHYWLEHTFLTWKWWLLIALTLIPWFLWWKFVDKRRVHDILFYGFSTAIMALFLDSVGSNLLWWGYPNEVYAVIPPLVPVDLTLVPVTMMVVFQISRLEVIPRKQYYLWVGCSIHSRTAFRLDKLL